MKQAIFRFYEELNDFLSKEKRKVSFIHTFEGNPSIKDVIEAIGVPHVEVDLIMVNSKSVDFTYILKDGDFVSVYPVFETLNLTHVAQLREKPLRDTKFILDVHLGRLVRYLRMLGFDSLYENNYPDNEIIRISLSDHRIILTRDIGLLKVKVVTHGYFIRSQHANEQLNEVVKHFDLFDSFKPFTRCIKCNGLLERVEKVTIESELKPLTRKIFNNFFRCTCCQTIYWEGSHFERMKQMIDSIRPDNP